MNRLPRLFALGTLSAMVVSGLLAGCHKKSNNEPSGPAATHLKIVDPNFGVTVENTSFTVTVLSLGTNDVPAKFSGDATISTATDGFVTPTTITLSGTATTLTLNYRLGGDNHMLLRAAGLDSAFSNVYVQGERPAVEQGPLTEGAVLIGSATVALWDSGGVGSPSVLSGATMKMYYSGLHAGTANIGLATSTDGLHWTRVGTTPLVGPGATAATCHTTGADRPMVIAKSGGGFVMFYRGRNGGHVHVCVAESADGTSWTPFVGAQEDGSVLARELTGFDSTSIDGLSPFAAGTGFGGLYSFHGNFPFLGLTSASGFAYATSPDGHVWTRHNAATATSAVEISWSDQPAGDSWDANVLGPVTVFPDAASYRIWAGGTATFDSIGYYTTFDLSFIGGHCDNFTSSLHEMIGTGGAGSFNATATREPDITVGPDGKRWLYFTGIDAAGKSSIGVARFSQ